VASYVLNQLPFDVVVKILLLLDVRDLLSIAQTCHHLNRICSSPFIWRYHASCAIHRSRPLVLRNTTDLQQLNVQQLRQAVIRTALLEHNWGNDKAVRIGIAKKVALRFPVTSPRSLFYTVFVRKYLLSPTEDRHLTVWDLERGKSIGKYDMRRTFAASGLILAVREHYPSHSLFYIVTGNLISADFGHTMEFYILHIRFPDENSAEPAKFQQVADFSFSMMQTVAMYILDAVRRIVCVVCRYPETDMLGIYVVLDWNTGESNLINTGLTYEYRKSVLGVRLSTDGQFILIRTERDGKEVMQCHSLASLREGSTTSCWKAKLFHPPASPEPQNVSETTSIWCDETDASSPFYQPLFTSPNAYADDNVDTVVFRCWNMSPWWPDYPDTPRPTSCVVLYRTTVTDPGPGANNQTWRISQYFTSGDVDKTDLDGIARPIGPFARRRFVITLKDPVLVSVLDDEMPVLGFSYNQAAWVEQVVEEETFAGTPPAIAAQVARRMLGRGRRMKKRLVARIASFPDPGTCPGEEGCEMGSSIKTLDVPPRVLAAARDISIDSELGTVSIITKSNAVHIYSYC